MEGVFGDGRAPAVRVAPAGRRDDDGGLPRVRDLAQDREAPVTACGRICMHRKRTNLSTVLAGQRLGIKEVDDGIWVVSFMH